MILFAGASIIPPLIMGSRSLYESLFTQSIPYSLIVVCEYIHSTLCYDYLEFASVFWDSVY